MKPVSIVSLVLVAGIAAPPAFSQQTPGPQPYFVGNPLGLPVNPAADGAFAPMSSNVKVFGAIYATESCSYDAERDLIGAPARGDALYESISDGRRFAGMEHWLPLFYTGLDTLFDHVGPIPVVFDHLAHEALSERRTLIEDYYDARRRSGPGGDLSMKPGEPMGEVKIEGSPWINDIEVAPDGTIYASNTGVGGKEPQPDSWQIWKVAPDGVASVWIQGAPLNQPNGIAFDTEGNVVVVNIGNDEVLTFAAADAKLLKTEKAAQPGNDGIVVLPDGTKYISSVMNGGITKLTPDGTASLIAENIPSAASMCYDAGAEQLVVPMNANNGLAFISLK